MLPKALSIIIESNYDVHINDYKYIYLINSILYINEILPILSPHLYCRATSGIRGKCVSIGTLARSTNGDKTVPVVAETLRVLR